MSLLDKQLTKDLGWWHSALCVHHRDLDWFPARGASTVKQRAVCDACPVQENCLEDALATPPTRDHGYVGGHTQSQRVKIRKARRRELRIQD